MPSNSPALYELLNARGTIVMCDSLSKVNKKKEQLELLNRGYTIRLVSTSPRPEARVGTGGGERDFYGETDR